MVCPPLSKKKKKQLFTPICITIRLPVGSRCFYRSIRVRGRWNTPKSKSGTGAHWLSAKAETVSHAASTAMSCPSRARRFLQCNLNKNLGVFSMGVANQPAPYRGLSGPKRPRCRKSLKNVSWGLRPRNPEESPKSLTNNLKRVFRHFPKTLRRLLRLFPGLLGSGARGPRRHFRDFFGISGPKGPRDLCKGWAGSQRGRFVGTCGRCMNFTTFRTSWKSFQKMSHPAAKRVRQKEFDKKVTKKVTEASEKVTKKWPKESRKRKKWSNSFCRPRFAAPWMSPSRTKKMWAKDALGFSKKHVPSQRRCGKSCCVWMRPHLLFCADSGAPILKTSKQKWGACTRVALVCYWFLFVPLLLCELFLYLRLAFYLWLVFLLTKIGLVFFTFGWDSECFFAFSGR